MSRAVERQLMLEQQLDKCIQALTDAEQTLEWIVSNDAFEMLEEGSSAPEVIKQIKNLLVELHVYGEYNAKLS